MLPPLVLRSSEIEPSDFVHRRNIDALIEAVLPGDESGFRFVVEAKSRATFEAVHAAVAQAKARVKDDEWPMIQVPFLAPDRLEFLEAQQVSGVDLCGNGIVVVPRRLWIVRSGQPNRYRDSRPLNNPYRGRSGMVARILLTEPWWPSLKRMVQWIRDAGADLSLAQASKAIRALEEELFVYKIGGTIKLQDPARLLDRLGSEWQKPVIRARQCFRLTKGDQQLSTTLSSDPALRWAVTGESSVSRYAVFSQGGPRQIAVSDLRRAASLLGGSPESVSNFADVQLLETDEPGFYFQTVTDASGIRWASRLQTWLELQRGDARQQEAAQDVRRQILRSEQR